MECKNFDKVLTGATTGCDNSGPIIGTLLKNETMMAKKSLEEVVNGRSQDLQDQEPCGMLPYLPK